MSIYRVTEKIDNTKFYVDLSRLGTITNTLNADLSRLKNNITYLECRFIASQKNEKPK